MLGESEIFGGSKQSVHRRGRGRRSLLNPATFKQAGMYVLPIAPWMEIYLSLQHALKFFFCGPNAPYRPTLDTFDISNSFIEL